MFPFLTVFRKSFVSCGGIVGKAGALPGVTVFDTFLSSPPGSPAPWLICWESSGGSGRVADGCGGVRGAEESPSCAKEGGVDVFSKKKIIIFCPHSLYTRFNA